MQLSNNIAYILKEIAKTAQKIFGNKLHSVVLYGSYARGRAQMGGTPSEILADVNDQELSLYRKPLIDICSDLGLEYDLLIVPTIQDIKVYQKYVNALPFFQNVEKEGIKIAV